MNNLACVFYINFTVKLTKLQSNHKTLDTGKSIFIKWVEKWGLGERSWAQFSK